MWHSVFAPKSRIVALIVGAACAFFALTSTVGAFNPYQASTCTSPNPYYAAPNCGATNETNATAPSLFFTAGLRCKTRPFKIRPKISGGIVSSVQYFLNDRLIRTYTVPPFNLKIYPSRMPKGKKNKIKVFVTLTSGKTLVMTKRFRKCGTPPKAS